MNKIKNSKEEKEYLLWKSIRNKYKQAKGTMVCLTQEEHKLVHKERNVR